MRKAVGRGHPYAHAAHVVHAAAVAAVALHGMHVLAVVHFDYVSMIK
jgi:hypothetical protein